MSTVAEVKQATERLSSKEKWELFVWLRESSDLRVLRLEELRREIDVGIKQADAGEVAPLDIPAIRARWLGEES